MQLSQFDYNLPKELIAQFPSEKRDHSNLMILSRGNKSVEHKKFFNIADYFGEDDVLVMNNTRVIPARLIGKKETGAVIEVFLLEGKGGKGGKGEEEDEFSAGCVMRTGKYWEVLIKPSKRVKAGTIITFSKELQAEVINRAGNDKWTLKLQYSGDFCEILDRVGNIPLPPYIQRSLTEEEIKKLDYERYQTVYAQNPGAVAAPTAGLHFTEELLKQLREKGVQTCNITLNVGLGTFKPVRAENILEHKMDSETYEISPETVEIIIKAKQSGKNIVAVGTTTVRTLESCYVKYGEIRPVKDKSQLFIYPGYEFKVVDKLITNFHLPKSTLLMLVSAFAGRDFVFEAYKEAIENNYRFYSYGDCMLIL